MAASEAAASPAKATPQEGEPAYMAVLDPNDESTHVDLTRVALSQVLETLYAELLFQNRELQAVEIHLRGEVR